MIKLDAMENPYGLSGEARAEIAAAVANVRINRYPDGGGDDVKAALRQSLALPDGVALVLGNGSDETAAAADRRRGQARRRRAGAGPVVRHVPDDRGAARTCATSACRCAADFTLDVDAMLAAIARDKPALVWLAYPNNPTGTLFPAADVERILARRARHRRRRRGVLRVRRRVVPAARARVPEPRRRAHGVEDRDGRRAAGLRGRASGVDRRARQGAPARTTSMR